MNDVSNAVALRSPFRSPAERAGDRQAKRDAVLLSAVRMFNKQGFHSTSLDDVAAALGVTKPMVYHYVGSKDQVLFECVRIGVAQLRDAMAAAAAQHGSGYDRLRAALLRYGAIAMEDFGCCVIRTSDELLSPESRAEFRRLKLQVDLAIRDLIRDGMRDGSIRPLDVTLAAFTFTGALSSSARWYDPAGPMSCAEIAATMVDTLMRGVEPE